VENLKEILINDAEVERRLKVFDSLTGNIAMEKPEIDS
jgi:hypothetical protein